MPSYGYEAINKMGKTVKGSMEANSPDQVKAAVKQQGMTPLSITEQNALTKDINIDLGSGIKAREMSVFCRQFISVTKAGVPIIECLGLLRDQAENKKLAKAIREVQAEVEKGETLSNAMAQQNKVFSNLMVSTVAAGEDSGSLDVSMDRMAIQYEKSAKTEALVKKAMIYPAFVFSAAIAVVIVMLVFVIPRFTSMFDDIGGELPGITKAVVAASDFFINYWFIIIPVVIAIIVGIRMFNKTPAGQLFRSKLALKLPVVKNLTVKSTCSQFARTMSTLLAAGVPMVEAIDMVSDTIQNVLFRDAIKQAKEEVMKGVPLSDPLQESGLFPPMLYHMTRIGEESGDIEEMLEKLADYYDEETENAIQSMLAIMEPSIILFMAVIVCLLIASVMAPMLEMYNQLNAM